MTFPTGEFQTQWSRTLSQFLNITATMTQYFSSHGGQEYLVGCKLATSF